MRLRLSLALLAPTPVLADPGDLDTGFAAGGIAIWDGAADGTDTGYDVALQPDGKILVAGQSAATYPSTDEHLMVLRYTQAGALDNSFATNGVFLWDGGGSGRDATGRAVTVQPNGGILVAGWSYEPPGVNAEVLVLRLSGAGALDPSFAACRAN